MSFFFISLTNIVKCQRTNQTGSRSAAFTTEFKKKIDNYFRLAEKFVAFNSGRFSYSAKVRTVSFSEVIRKRLPPASLDAPRALKLQLPCAFNLRGPCLRYAVLFFYGEQEADQLDGRRLSSSLVSICNIRGAA